MCLQTNHVKHDPSCQLYNSLTRSEGCSYCTNMNNNMIEFKSTDNIRLYVDRLSVYQLSVYQLSATLIISDSDYRRLRLYALILKTLKYFQPRYPCASTFADNRTLSVVSKPFHFLYTLQDSCGQKSKKYANKSTITNQKNPFFTMTQHKC